VLVAAVMFWLVIKPVNRLMSTRRTEAPVAQTTRECPQCLSEIPIAAHRCAFCTSQLD
jgi:large conductance mechanosensitive channel